jgi:GAF domain-containing protein
MADVVRLERWTKLIDAVSRLTGVRSVDDIVTALREGARMLGAADGISIIRREGNRVAYIAEDALSSLWSRQSFPLHKCISGIAMLERRPILVPDIRRDPRVPQEPYLSTYVKSMAMFPIGPGEPELAMGIYWREAKSIDPETVSLLTGLARSAGAAFEKVRLLEQSRAVH